jgi:hypothetical protein
LAEDLNAEQYAHLIAILSSEPPAGWTRWTLSHLAEELVRRGIVARLSSEELRRKIEKTVPSRFVSTG